MCKVRALCFQTYCEWPCGLGQICNTRVIRALFQFLEYLKLEGERG